MYKRGINNIDSIKNMDMYISSNYNAYTCLGGNLNMYKPYYGLYIKSSKIYVSNVVEKLEIGNETFRISDFNTIAKKISSDEYLDMADIENNYFEYTVGQIHYAKKLSYINNSDTLCIEYYLQNNSKQKSIFKVIPLVTYRDMLLMKKSSFLKFNKRKTASGVLINLSVTDDENVIIKSDYARYNEIDNYLNNINHEILDEKLTKQLFVEDLYVPGEFEIKLKPGSENIFRIYISHKDFELTDYLNRNLDLLLPKNSDSIKEEFVELKKLTKAISCFELQDMISSIPSFINISKIMNNFDEKYIEIISKQLCNIVKSIEGEYLVLKEIQKAKSRLLNILEYIQIIDKSKENENDELIKLKLWCIEEINKIYEKDNNLPDKFKEFVRNSIIEFRADMLENKCKYLDKIEYISLMYNAFKIYENICDDNTYFEVSKALKQDILIKFWDSTNRVLKYDLNEEEVYSTPEMVYTLSLSHQSVDSDISVKLLDTVFKELYTPYGLREFSKFSSKNIGVIYPKYMAHFVKANLRQNGVTFASQKISYNLVKELLLEIGKHVTNTVKSVYHEKGLNIESSAIDLLTTAEMIRLYDMLT